MEKPIELNQIIPEDLINLIGDHIKAGVSDAESKFALNEEDEDSITGALGQAISTAHPIVLTTAQGKFTYEITSRKLRGRGPDAPEKRLGADAIFQIEVFRQGQRVFRKGLPFQAKNGGGFQNSEVIKQAGDLHRTTGTGIIVRFSKDGYTAINASEIVFSDQANAVATPQIIPTKLGSVLGNDFLNCRVGKIGLTYDSEAVSGDSKGIWVISTKVASEGNTASSD